MSSLVLLDVANVKQAEMIRQAEMDRMLTKALRGPERPPVLKSLVQALRRR